MPLGSSTRRGSSGLNGRKGGTGICFHEVATPARCGCEPCPPCLASFPCAGASKGTKRRQSANSFGLFMVALPRRGGRRRSVGFNHPHSTVFLGERLVGNAA